MKKGTTKKKKKREKAKERKAKIMSGEKSEREGRKWKSFLWVRRTPISEKMA
jgi:hypothetical protein